MSPDTSAKLAALPGVKEAAEEMAREAHNLFARLTWSIEDGWGELDDDARTTLIRVHLTLLCDLTRPASRDWWARWLAERVGAKVGATAPEWVKSRRHRDLWTLRCSRWETWTFRHASPDPAEALAAACLAVGGAS